MRGIVLGSVAASGAAGGGESPYSASMAFSGSTKPAEFVDVALTTHAAASSSMSSGILREGSSAASDGNHYTMTKWGLTVPGSNPYWAQVTFGNITISGRGVGACMSNSDSTRVIAAIGRGDGSTRTYIVTHISGTRTVRATTGTSPQWESPDNLRLVYAISGSDIVWTVWENGVATACTWTDTNGATFGLPGREPGGIFEHSYSNGQFTSPGIRGFEVQKP